MALFGFAGSGNDIRIRFLADTSNVTQATGELGNGISKGLGLASVGWAAAGAAAADFAKQSVDAAMNAEDAENRLNDTYQRFGAIHDVTVKSLTDLADATQQKTRFDHLAAMQAEETLAMYHLTGGQIEELLPLVEDFAAKTGKDLPTAAEAVGKALLGNTRALKAVGISYKMTGDAATDYHNIVALLTAQVGGAAAADAETTAGKLAMLKNRYAELKEQFGAALLPLITALAPAVIKVLDVLTMSLQGWGLAFQWVADHGSLLAQILENLVGGPILWLVLNTNVVSVALSWLGTVFGWVAGIISGAFAAALNWVIGALSWLWGIVSSVASAVGGFFAGAFHAAEGAINAVVHAVEWLIDKLHALQGIWNAVSGFIGRIGSAIGLHVVAPEGGALALAGGAGPTVYAAGAGPSSFGGSSSSSGGGLNVSINVHGNVGDPNIIGRRVVDALATYVRTNGARTLRGGARDRVTTGAEWQSVLSHRVELSDPTSGDASGPSAWGLSKWDSGQWSEGADPPFRDVTPDVLSIHTVSGGQGLDLSSGVATVELTLVDLAGKYSSDGSTDWLLGRRVRGFVTPVGRPEAPAFYGIIDKVSGGGTFLLPTLDLTAYGTLSLVGAAATETPVADQPETAATRLTNILVAAGFAPSQMTIEDDTTTLVADDTANLGDLWSRTVESCGGLAYADAAGHVVTRNRAWVTGTADGISAWIYAGTPPYGPDEDHPAPVAETTGELNAAQSFDTVANVVSYANRDDPVVVVVDTDPTSIGKYGFRHKDVTDLSCDLGVLETLSARDLSLHAEPLLVCDSATVTVYDADTAAVAALDVGMMVTLGRNDPGVASWEWDGIISGIERTVSPDRFDIGLTIVNIGTVGGFPAVWDQALWDVDRWQPPALLVNVWVLGPHPHDRLDAGNVYGPALAAPVLLRPTELPELGAEPRELDDAP